MEWLFYLISAIAAINLGLIISMIFLEKKKPQSIMAWLTVLTFLPVIGFVFYILLGSGLSIRTRRMIRKKAISEHDIIANVEGIQTLEQASIDGITKDDRELITLCYNFGSYPCPGNSAKIYNWGKDKLADLKRDIKNARYSINIEYYIFARDKTGREIMELLCQRARDGVDVKLIYDSVGSRKAPRRFFRQLRKAGGQVAEFFPPILRSKINLKVNYRNHRKIVVIDGLIAYTGGINLRDDHMGLDKRLAPWRDTAIRLEGAGAYALQNIFLDDWRYCKKDNTPPSLYLVNGSFPKPRICGDVAVQVLSSGPDSPVQKIKEAFVKLITSAKQRVYIQTPYFVPDDVFTSALRIAIKSGVDVRIMVPKIPDKKSVYLVTLSYLKEMVETGAQVYLYDGFLHAKTILVDDNKLSIGTCNTDNRSFGLNFEDTAILYSKTLNTEYARTFSRDMKRSYRIGLDYFKKKKWLTKFLQAIFRLLAAFF